MLGNSFFLFLFNVLFYVYIIYYVFYKSNGSARYLSLKILNKINNIVVLFCCEFFYSCEKFLFLKGFKFMKSFTLCFQEVF